MSNSEENTFSVYIYYNPLKDNEEFYVGISKNSTRYIDHLDEAKRLIKEERTDEWIEDNYPNASKFFIIREILNSGLEPIIVKVLENVDKQTAKTEAIRLIALYGRLDKGTGSLTNRSNGGECGGGIREDLIGQKFGRWVVLELSENTISYHSKWLCKCECGTEKIVRAGSLKKGDSKSCGCLNKEIITKHGMFGTPIYRIWENIIGKCSNPNHRDYKDYGGRGIKICERWNSSEGFINFSKDIGERPTDTHRLGRINTNRKFEPSNCKWISSGEHVNNRKNRRELIVDNEAHSLAEWSRISGTKYQTIYDRLLLGWDEKEAVFGKK